MKDEFLDEIEDRIRKTMNLERWYKYMQLSLMTLITVCGFLTAAASNAATRDLWVSNPHFLLIFGLLSAIGAIVNQVMSPAEKYIFHKQVKKAMRNIRGAVKFGGMHVAQAERLRAQASIDPSAVISQIIQSSTSIDESGPNKQLDSIGTSSAGPD